ncbi:hypothetical protein Mag101_04295 [Microbulbifer agarilyticus]|uniref:Glycosyltransferase 61 catalytic domain-containing protein n=1 Tax=Microbulbifer agarilyticus TaxID=260552 RepID=A0A1Q2M2J6_9GAMM|nr:glycosyltransferase family 61 protein [Microbulbifer agarilyticus]AQQ66943.1 hypothetical protein Mag101_04295 [Microbulbifer agarilyticus]
MSRFFCFDELLKGEDLDVEVERRCLVDAKREVSLSARLKATGPRSSTFQEKHRGFFVYPALGVLEIAEAEILCTGVVKSRCGSYVASKNQFSEEQLTNFSYSPVGIPKRVSDSVVPLLRPGDHIYGHWLVDILPRLWLLKQVYDFKELKFLVKESVPAFALRLLSAVGVGSNQILKWDAKSGGSIIAKRVVMPTNLRYGQVIHPRLAEYASWLKGQIRPSSRGLAGDKKVYLSRGKWRKTSNATRDLANSSCVEEMYIANGYKVIYPEEYSLEEQVRIFHDSDAVAGEEGSALHNNIFMREGTLVTCFRGELNHSLIQSTLCSAMSQRSEHAFGKVAEGVAIPSRTSPYSVDLATIRELISS